MTSLFDVDYEVTPEGGHRRTTPYELPEEEPLEGLGEFVNFRLPANFVHTAPNSTTFADVAGFSFELQPGETRKFKMLLSIEGNETADVKLQLNGPAGAVGQLVAMGLAPGASSDGGASRLVTRGLNTPTGNFGLLTVAAQPVIIEGTVHAPDGGVFQLQTGQGTANATAHQIQAGSSLEHRPFN